MSGGEAVGERSGSVTSGKSSGGTGARRSQSAGASFLRRFDLHPDRSSRAIRRTIADGGESTSGACIGGGEQQRSHGWRSAWRAVGRAWGSATTSVRMKSLALVETDAHFASSKRGGRARASSADEYGKAPESSTYAMTPADHMSLIARAFHSSAPPASSGAAYSAVPPHSRRELPRSHARGVLSAHAHGAAHAQSRHEAEPKSASLMSRGASSAHTVQRMFSGFKSLHTRARR